MNSVLVVFSVLRVRIEMRDSQNRDGSDFRDNRWSFLPSLLSLLSLSSLLSLPSLNVQSLTARAAPP